MENPPNSPSAADSQKEEDEDKMKKEDEDKMKKEDEARPDDPRAPYSPSFLSMLTPEELAKLRSKSPKVIYVKSDTEPAMLRTQIPAQLIPSFDKNYARFPYPYQFKPEDWNPVLGRYTLIHPENSECWVPEGADTRDVIGVFRCPLLKESGERFFKTRHPLDRSKWWIWDPHKEYYFDGIFLKSRAQEHFVCQLEELGESVEDTGVYDRYGFH
ncbi:hypothetical protein TWF281_002957 [Arthrobotrys megalospora]